MIDALHALYTVALYVIGGVLCVASIVYTLSWLVLAPMVLIADLARAVKRRLRRDD